MSIKSFPIFILTIILLHKIFINSVLAVNLNIKDFPATITDNNAFEVKVEISGANEGTNYLRIDLFKEGTTNYFGETYNGSSYYNGSEGTSYYPVSIPSEGTASATLKGKIGSPSVGEYPSIGSYKLRIRRYTASGSSASNDSQTPVSLNLDYVILQTTPNPSPTPTPTANPSPTPTILITPTPTKKPTLTPTKVPTIETEKEDNLLGANMEITPTPEELSTENQTKKTLSESLLAKILIISGLAFILIPGFLLLRPVIFKYNSKNEQI